MLSEAEAKIVSEIKDADVMVEAIELIYSEKLGEEGAQAVVDRVLQKPARFVSNSESPHFHSPRCSFAQLIPKEKRAGFYSRHEAKKRGKIACMNCL